MYRKTMQRVVLVCLLSLGFGVATSASAMPTSYSQAIVAIQPSVSQIRVVVAEFFGSLLGGWFSQGESGDLQKDGCQGNSGSCTDPNGG